MRSCSEQQSTAVEVVKEKCYKTLKLLLKKLHVFDNLEKFQKVKTFKLNRELRVDITNW